MNNYERIGTLMFRYARRELTGKEKKELTAWRRAHPEEENLFKNSTDPEDIMVNVGAFLASKEKGLQKLKDRYPDIWKDSPASRYNTRYWMIGIAAVLLIGLSLIRFLLSG
jgi:hypothetical protein